jgi:membrane-associated protein
VDTKTRALSDVLSFNLLDPKSIIQTLGLVGVYAIVFAETGLFFGFFLPGDSLLFIAGVSASPVAEKLVGAKLSLPLLLIGVPILAIAGAQLGHYLGARFGRALFDRPDSRIFKKKHVDKAEYYFNKFGPAKAVVLARLIPVVRTFLNPVAGILEMPAKKFFLWNVIGGVVWTEAVLLVGYKLADVIPSSVIDKYMIPAVGVIVVVSALPVIIEVIRGWREKNHAQPAAPAATTSADRSGERVER